MPYGIYNKIVCDRGEHSKFTPQKHQSDVLDYFLNKLEYKGLLLYHKLGSGKSCSSIMISDEMINASKVKKVFVMTPGSLRQNFIEEYCSKCGYKPSTLKKHYTFITINYTVGERLPDLNNSLVIIDEVHNLIKGVKNQSKHATLIYNNLMKSDCKILALTGTPVFNEIWEWPFLGNLLKPGVFDDLLKYKELDTETFMKKFVIDKEGNVIPKNPKMFAINLRGIISYFPGIGGGFYPEVIHEKPIQVYMTVLQEQRYWEVSNMEQEIRNTGPPPKTLLRTDPKLYSEKMELFIMAAGYIMSRYASNFYYPEKFSNSKNPESRDEVHHIGEVDKYVHTPSGEWSFVKNTLVNKFYNIELNKYEDKSSLSLSQLNKIKSDVENDIKIESELNNIGWIQEENFTNKKLVDVYSRKFMAIITNMLFNWNAKHVVFSFFKTKSGVNIIHALFKMCGIKTEIYSGDISDSVRRKILKKFNSEKNRYGQNIKALLITEAGAEGINVLETQHIHIVESSIREQKIQQAIGRVVRYKSHMVEGRKPMPKNEQVVHIWRYWTTSNSDPFTLKKQITNTDGTVSTSEKVIVNKEMVDEILYNKGRVLVNGMQSFLSLLKNASVTSYDKDQDRESKLIDYKALTIRPELLEAFEISNQRYRENKVYLPTESDTKISKIMKEVQDFAGEEKDDLLD